MYEFLDRLINVALPRVRDFKGVPSKGFDGRGNYALGLREQVIFPEIVYDKVDKVRGMDISIVTTARTDEDAKRSEEHTSELQSRLHLVCRLLLEKKKNDSLAFLHRLKLLRDHGV